MKTLIVCLMLVGYPITIFAGERFISYQASSFNHDDDNFKENAFLQAVETGYSWKNVEAGLESSMAKHTSGWNSTFRETSYLITIKLKLPLKRFMPYGVAGVGMSWFSDKDMKDKGMLESVKNERSLAYKGGIGVEYRITKHISLFVESAYRYSDTGEGSSLDSWGWGYGGGCKIRF